MSPPINTRSLNEILDIVESENGADIPREDIRDEILKQNRTFYNAASDNDINKHFLREILTLQKTMEMAGQDEASDSLESVIDTLEKNI
jgi:hypothetical protein